MTAPARFLMTDPSAYEVSYRINPWMDPDAWTPERSVAAIAASGELRAALQDLGARIEMIEAIRGLPDLVFPANAAVVLDGRVLLARFRHPERQGEEMMYRAAFAKLQARGVITEVVELPEGVLQEGAGDAIWDAVRSLFWVGFGPRSHHASLNVIGETFGQEVVGLALASERFYHLDTCFCPLSGGQVLYHPAAFTPAALAEIRARVAEADRIEASAEDAAAFCVNAVNLGQTIVMAKAPVALRARLEAGGYRVVEVDLSPFILSGGGAYCMTLRLDRQSQVRPTVLAAE